METLSTGKQQKKTNGDKISNHEANVRVKAPYEITDIHKELKINRSVRNFIRPDKEIHRLQLITSRQC